jgi:hypothetical protein
LGSSIADNLWSQSDDASQRGVADNANATGRDGSDDGDLPTVEDNLPIPVLLADDEDNPQPLAALPIDFHMEDSIPLNDDQKHHQVAFYQAVLSSFLIKGSNSSMMMEEKWEIIRSACLRLHNGET